MLNCVVPLSNKPLPVSNSTMLYLTDGLSTVYTPTKAGSQSS